MRNLKTILALSLIATLVACSSSSSKSEDKTIMMATTTSMNDSGLLDELKPAFKKETGIDLKWTSVGSGEAIKLARDGEADLLFAHSPDDEDKLVEDKVSNGRTKIMYNNFLLVGPKKLSGTTLKDVVKDVCDNQLYVSRADDSGTHKKEIKMFEENCGGQKPKKYKESNSGMLDTLNVASEKKAVTLVDIATWLANKDKLDLEEAFYDKKELVNTYSIHTINHKNVKDAQKKNAEEFKKWVSEGKGLELIKEYGKEKYKTPVFTLIEDK